MLLDQPSNLTFCMARHCKLSTPQAHFPPAKQASLELEIWVDFDSSIFIEFDFFYSIS